jgi:phosphatidylserine/phosphatidylglycerophosphate/cardiolipin synthase-like enzyme
VTLWQDADIFHLVARLIESARTRVMVEMYELGRRDLVSALGSAHARGVAVKVITDPTVNASRRSVVLLDRLQVPERAYPVDDVRHQIDHVKLLIADGEAVVGGMNWGAHSSRNHDYVLETHVPAEIGRLARIFAQDWDLAGGHAAPLAPAPSEIAQTAPGEEIRAMLEGALGRARVRVLAEVYTFTDPQMLAGLAAAHRRGASVRVLLDPNQPYNRHAYAVLSSSGVAVRWYPVPKGALLHAKIGLFDGELILGSANWRTRTPCRRTARGLTPIGRSQQVSSSGEEALKNPSAAVQIRPPGEASRALEGRPPTACCRSSPEARPCHPRRPGRSRTP